MNKNLKITAEELRKLRLKEQEARKRTRKCNCRGKK